jgi:hypothetical protein
MSRTDDRSHTTLPVTSEVGGEGGSFADPTSQVATFEGDIGRTSGAGESGSAATQATRRHDIPDADRHPGMIRYPTEPPSAPIATADRHIGTGAWRHRLMGAAAGAAAAAVVALGINGLRQRRR